MDQTDLKKALYNAALDLYESYERVIRPLHPWVLVKVLPKVIKIGSLWMPGALPNHNDGKQNTVLYEGLVLATWQPIWKRIRLTPAHKELWETKYHAPVPELISKIEVKSELKPGDHVLFPHYEGLPVPYLNKGDKDEWRLIREINPADSRCVAHATVEYSNTSIKDNLRLTMEQTPGIQYIDQVENVVERLLEKYVIVPRVEYSVTTSGA